MVKKEKSGKEGKKSDCCSGSENKGACCAVNAVLTVDSRGQTVFPKELREKAGIKAGDKLAVICVEKAGKFCCMTLVKADALGQQAKGMIGPIVMVKD